MVSPDSCILCREGEFHTTLISVHHSDWKEQVTKENHLKFKPEQNKAIRCSGINSSVVKPGRKTKESWTYNKKQPVSHEGCLLTREITYPHALNHKFLEWWIGGEKATRVFKSVVQVRKPHGGYTSIQPIIIL